jgi:hypothetical protein
MTLFEKNMDVGLPPVESYFDPKAMESLRVPAPKSRSKLIRMPINDFLKMAKHLDAPCDYKAENVAKMLKKGKKFESFPYLLYEVREDMTAKVIAHEGRHRGMAFRDMGYTHMPVEFRGDIRWSDQNNPKSYDYWKEFPAILINEDGNGRIWFPVKREEADKAYDNI